MKTNKTAKIFLIAVVLAFLAGGCIDSRRNALTQMSSAKPQPVYEAGKFAQDSQGPSAVDSAIELAEKHAELSEEMMTLQKKHQELLAENKQLKTRITTIEPKLKQAEKELSEANDALIELTIEINNWKSQVTGFQNEIRDADKAQIKALYKILMVLGGKTDEPNE